AAGAARGPANADPAGSRELADPVRAEELLERIELLRLSDDLEDERLRPDVRNTRVEDVRQREQLGAPLGCRRDGDQRQLALDRVVPLELAHTQHVDELVHLLLDLLERLLLAVHAQGDPGYVRAFGRPDREALDVEGT